jgi:hypothetical protein
MQNFKNLAFLSLTFCSLSQAYADPIWYGTQNTDWFDSNNWSTNVIPSQSSSVFLEQSGSYTDLTFSSSNPVCDSITVQNKPYSFGPGSITQLELTALNTDPALNIQSDFSINEFFRLIFLNSGTISVESPFTNKGIIAGTSVDLTITGQSVLSNSDTPLGSISYISHTDFPVNNIYLNTATFQNLGGAIGLGMSGTIFINDSFFTNADGLSGASGQILGPLEVNNLNSGLLTNDATDLVLSAPAIFSSSINTTDNINSKISFTSNSGTTIYRFINSMIQQNTIEIGNTTGTIYPVLFYSNDTIEAYGTTSLNDQATLIGSILINGNFISNPGSNISPGSDQSTGTIAFEQVPPLESLRNNQPLIGSVTYQPTFSSNFNIKLDDLSSDEILVTGAALFNGTSSFNFSILNPGTGQTTYTFFKTTDGITIDPSGTITYSFPSGYDASIFSIKTSGYNLSLIANFPLPPGPPFSNPSVFTGPAATTANLLNAITGKCAPQTQTIIDDVISQPEALQQQSLDELSPQFKVIQFSLEKLSFQIQKELDADLYNKDTGTQTFLIAGYDYLNQDKTSTYTGYTVNTAYQLLGASHGFNTLKVQGMFGVSESWMKLSPIESKATYNTIYGSLGIRGNFDRWNTGIKSLFGYSFSNTKREISFLDYTAKSSHGIWILNTEGLLSYTLVRSPVDLNAYESFGYVYSVENAYSEHNAPGANLRVKDEVLSLCRNSLGLNVKGPKDKNLGIYADLAWVYEFYLNTNNFKAKFIGSDVYATYKPTNPTKNYARLGFGYEGSYKHLEYRIAYDGLFGKKFLEQSASLKLGYKF